MLSYQNQHLEQFYDPQEFHYQTMEVEQQTNVQKSSNLKMSNSKVILQSTPDYPCYIETPSPQHRNQTSFNQAQYTYNTNCNQNTLVLSPSSAPMSNESNHHSIGQLEGADQSSGYGYNQVQHHHYISHEQQQHIDQCRRTQASNRISHLEHVSNNLEPNTTTTKTTTTTTAANTLNTPVSGNQQKQQQQPTQHQQTHKQNSQLHNQHLIAPNTHNQPQQESSTLVAANHETDPTRSQYATRIQPNEAQVDDMYNNNNCNNVTYQDHQLEQFYEPQDSYYQTMEAEHEANLNYSGNLQAAHNNKLIIQSTGDYPCYIEPNNKNTQPQHQQSHEFNQSSHYEYNHCDHNQNNIVLSTSTSLNDLAKYRLAIGQVESGDQNGYDYNQVRCITSQQQQQQQQHHQNFDHHRRCSSVSSPTSASSVCLSSIGSSASPVDNYIASSNNSTLQVQLQPEPIILEHYQPQSTATTETSCDVISTSSVLGMHTPVEDALDSCIGGQQEQQQQFQQQQQQQQVKKQIYRSSPIHLWEFLKELLQQVDSGCADANVIRWLDRQKGVFKIEDSVRVAKLWGKRKNKPKMNYDKLSRSIRQYYKKGIMKKTDRSQRLVYQFCSAYCH